MESQLIFAFWLERVPTETFPLKVAVAALVRLVRPLTVPAKILEPVTV